MRERPRRASRATTSWASGGDTSPPILLPPPTPARAGGAVGEVLDGVRAGEEVGVDEIVTLLGARGPELAAVCGVADDLRREISGDTVTFVRNRNINYTNICTFKCRFCAFSKGPLSLNLRGDPYLLGVEEIQARVVEAVECGATEVCLQGGIHPDFDGDYYLDIARAVKEVAPDIHVHGFTALEVTEGARRLGMDLGEYLTLAKEAGLVDAAGHRGGDPRRRGPRRHLPRQDQHRGVARGAPGRARRRPALERHDHVRPRRAAGARGPPPGAHPGAAEGDRRVHRVRAAPLRAHGDADLPAASKARKGPTFRELLLMQAVGRIAYREWIPNIQVSWVKTGIAGARQALQAGCNDLGGTLMDENISRAAGANHGQEADESDFHAMVRPARPPARAAHHAVRPDHDRRSPPAPAARGAPRAAR